MVLTATFAFKANSFDGERSPGGPHWDVAGIAVLFRPDSGLFAAAIGMHARCFDTSLLSEVA